MVPHIFILISNNFYVNETKQNEMKLFSRDAVCMTSLIINTVVVTLFQLSAGACCCLAGAVIQAQGSDQQQEKQQEQ